MDFIEGIRYKPSIIHTTFSNLTERKNFKYCYHLIYFFDDIIYGEEDFNHVFSQLTDDYKDFVDDNCKDCHRVIFTSNSALDNYVYSQNDISYQVGEFIHFQYDDISLLHNWENNDGLDKSYISHNNLSRESNISQEECKERKVIENAFNLDKDFYNDLYSLKRSEFIEKYSVAYPYFRETVINPDRYIEGYVDLRNDDYYDVPTSRYRWDVANNKPFVPKVEKGKRNTMLWVDCCCLMKIKPDITKEHLVYLLILEVYRNFDNNDGEMTNQTIITKAKEVWNSIGNVNIRPLKKTFKIDKEYWLAKGYTNNDWLKITRMIMKIMRCNDIGGLYDLSLSVEQNLEMLRAYGVKTTKKTLVKWLKENGLQYESDKKLRDEMVIGLYQEDATRSSREIERLCKEKGVKVSYRTIQTIISRHKYKPQKCFVVQT